MVVAPGLRLMQRSAKICNVVIRNIARCLRPSISRSKFNVALGVESQGFCLLK